MLAIRIGGKRLQLRPCHGNGEAGRDLETGEAAREVRARAGRRRAAEMRRDDGILYRRHLRLGGCDALRLRPHLADRRGSLEHHDDADTTVLLDARNALGRVRRFLRQRAGNLRHCCRRQPQHERESRRAACCDCHDVRRPCDGAHGCVSLIVTAMLHSSQPTGARAPNGEQSAQCRRRRLGRQNARGGQGGAEH
jgi:hypothetical protein